MPREGLAILLLLCGAVSCAPGTAKRPDKERPVVLDVVKSEDEERTAVLATPTDFVVDAGDDYYAWQRTLFFFDTYTPGKKLREDGARTLVMSAAGDRTPFVYKVLREPAGGGMRYRVRCVPASAGASPAAAEHNSRNLSRFIKSGALELSMLGH